MPCHCVPDRRTVPEHVPKPIVMPPFIPQATPVIPVSFAPPPPRTSPVVPSRDDFVPPIITIVQRDVPRGPTADELAEIEARRVAVAANLARVEARQQAQQAARGGRRGSAISGLSLGGIGLRGRPPPVQFWKPPRGPKLEPSTVVNLVVTGPSGVLETIAVQASAARDVARDRRLPGIAGTEMA